MSIRGTYHYFVFFFPFVNWVLKRIQLSFAFFCQVLAVFYVHFFLLSFLLFNLWLIFTSYFAITIWVIRFFFFYYHLPLFFYFFWYLFFARPCFQGFTFRIPFSFFPLFFFLVLTFFFLLFQLFRLSLDGSPSSQCCHFPPQSYCSPSRVASFWCHCKWPTWEIFY